MKHECHIVHSTTRNIHTNAIVEYTIFNCFETLPQAKASLQYEYDLYLREHCDPLDETDRPVWMDEEHTELKLPVAWDPAMETVLYIDSTVDYHDKDEPLMKYGE